MLPSSKGSANASPPRVQPDDPNNPSRRKPAITLIAVLLLVAVALWVVWSVPHRVVQRRMDTAHPLTVDKQLDLEDAYRKTITQIVLSVFGLYILYLSYRRAEAGDKTVRIMEQGHITDRFTKAIEQLGKTDGDKPNIEVRLGAIYALERIALDSPRDHWTIMEVLTAYVRQNAPLDADRPYTEGEKPRTDIQAILTVLGRRLTGPKRERLGQRLDLSGSRLCGASLNGVNLQNANLDDANLQEVSLVGASLQGTLLRQARLQNADLDKVNLRQAVLIGANLQSVILIGAELGRADLFQVNLQEAHLREANLQNAMLGFADLREADLTELNMQQAGLMGANLQWADLTQASLQGASLDDADFQKAFGLTSNQIKCAVDWQTAHYSPAFRAELGLPPEPEEADATHSSPAP